MTHDEPDARLLTLLNLAFLVVLFAMTVWYQTGRQRVPGVVTRAIGPCDVDWFGEQSALVVACPGARHDPGVAAADGTAVVGEVTGPCSGLAGISTEQRLTAADAVQAAGHCVRTA